MSGVNLRVKKRNIDDKAIDSSKLEFLNQDEFKSLKADGTVTSLFKLNGSDKFELLKLPIVGSNPTAANELARKEYVDAGDTAVRAEFAAADALVLAEAKEYTDDEVAIEKGERQAEDALIRSEFAFADEGVLQSAKDYTDAEILENVTQKLGVASGIATLNTFGKVPVAQLPNAIMEYQGVWSAATNTPTLSNLGNAPTDLGNVYKVTAAGSVDFGAGAISFEVGDYAILGTLGWEKSDTTDQVTSVNGQAGIVSLSTDNINEGAINYYFTQTRARSAAVIDMGYTGTETDQALSVRATKALVDSITLYLDDEIATRAVQDKRLLSAADITNQYIELAYKAHADSIVPSIDRLLLIEGDDYTVQVVGGKTRLMFTGSIATGGFEAVGAGDRVVVRYLKDLRV